MAADCRYHRRRCGNRMATALSIGAAAFGLTWLVLILLVLVVKGVGGLSLAVFTEMTPPPGSAGGLLNAIVGSLILTVLARDDRHAARHACRHLYGGIWPLLQAHHGGPLHQRHSPQRALDRRRPVRLRDHGRADGAFLRPGPAPWRSPCIVIPVVVRTTEDMLLLVPNTLREASAALGMPRWLVIRHVAYRAARAGIITGVLLAIARITGETAPLLFTALNNQFFSWNLNAPMASLPVVIFQFALSPYEDWQQLAWTGALLITVTVLGLSILARALASKKVQL